MLTMATGRHYYVYYERQHGQRSRDRLLVLMIAVLFVQLSRSSTTMSDVLTVYLRCPAVCHCYNNFQTVDCSQRHLSLVPAQLPTNARRIYLEDNNIGQVDLERLARSRHVSQLVLDRNHLTSVDTWSLCMMTSLQELSLSANMIKLFRVNQNCALLTLRQLDLSLNLLTTVPANLSSFAPRLEILDLSCNEITQATLGDSFRQLTSLRQLDLSRNRIHLLSASDLEPLRHVPLDVLNLAETELVAVEDTALTALSASLKYLSLAGNPLDPDSLERSLVGCSPAREEMMEKLNWTVDSATENISDESVGLPLTRLSISEMTVGNLSSAMLCHFRHLLVLDAAFSDLEYVDSQLFDCLTRLETLHLEAGKLTSVDNLSATKNLRRVYLQQNQLTEVVT